MRTFFLGNGLRGYFTGEFGTLEEAWDWLSRRFLLSYPVGSDSNGRSVRMYVREANPYGLMDSMACKEGNTDLGIPAPDDEVITRCTRSIGFNR